jgi:cytochrome c
MRRVGLALVGLALACAEPQEAGQATARADDPAPAVFRSTLDGRTRVLTAKLAPALWAAWDVEQAALFKLWRDGVLLDGAVYTGQHGPQPVSQGKAWIVDSYHEPWRLVRDGRELRPRVRYRGHAFEADAPRLRYDLVFEDEAIRVEEVPSVVQAQDGTLGFARRFVTSPLPEGHSLALDVALGSIDPQRDVETDGRFEPRATFSAAAGSGRLSLRPEGETRLVLWLREPPSLAPPRPETSDGPAGLRLIEQHDCLVCHSLERNTVGPSFRAISSRYREDAIPALVDKLIQGGSGVWGTPVMTPHPDLPASEARQMVAWILSLEAGAPQAVSPSPPARRLFSGWGEFFAEVGRRLRPGNAPGDGLPLESVHPAFELETIRPPGFQPRVGGLDFLSDGRLVVASWDPHGSVFLVEGVGSEARARRIATGLAEPLGLRVVDDDLYVLQKPELTRLVDRDGDDVIDEYQTLSQNWQMTTNFHEFAFGLAYRDGFFYATLATAILPGGASALDQVRDRGRVVAISREDGSLRFLADGLRTPNGIGFGPRGLLYVTDNQGDWLPASKVLALHPEASDVFFGSRSVLGAAAAERPVTPPVVWLPQGEIGNSPAEPAPLDVGPYRGQLVYADVTHGGLKRVFIEQVGGVLQGVVFRFSQGFEAGLNRIVWGPDGCLYVGGIGSNGNWGQPDKQRFGLERLCYANRAGFEMLAIRMGGGGFEVEFTEPVAVGFGEEAEDYQVAHWRYRPSAEYGGPKLDFEELAVEALDWSPDRRRVRLAVAGLEAGRVVHLRLAKSGFRSQSGSKLWATEAWYTLNALATSEGGGG